MKKDHNEHIYLIPQRTTQDIIQWNWFYKGDYGSSNSLPTIDLEADSGNHKIYFTIADPENEIKFAGYNEPNPNTGVEKAIWITVKQSETTAKKLGIEDAGQIHQIKFGQKPGNQAGTQLTLQDKNKDAPIDFLYQLNFVDSTTGLPVTAIDPEIKNGGGTQPFDWYAYAILGAVAGAVLMLAFARWGLGWQKLK